MTDVSAGEFVLRINAQCLFYLQELFRAMLVPVMSDRGLVTQWRINGLFLDGLEDVEEVDLGPAGPRKILKLGGHMLEQTALIVNGTADEANLGAPGSFDLALFPRLQYLRLDRCGLVDVKNLGVLRSRLKVCVSEHYGEHACGAALMWSYWCCVLLGTALLQPPDCELIGSS